MRNPFLLKLGTCISVLFTVLVGSKAQTVSYSHAVDLGLSVKWADMNVGASTPTGYGNHYAWGETETRNSFTEEDYKYYINGEYKYIGKNIAGTRYDVARMKWGGRWRMPSKEQFQELEKLCTWRWGKLNGVRGWKVIGPNGNYIFFPATMDNGMTCRYWSSSVFREDQPDRAWSLSIAFNNQIVEDNKPIFNWGEFGSREWGQCVRPVLP